MAQFKNAMEIFKLLDKSNCKKCNKPNADAHYKFIKVRDAPKSDPAKVRKN